MSFTNYSIFSRKPELFKKMIEKILTEESKKYLMKYGRAKGNGYYKNT